MSAYWPWWAGALALGVTAVAHARLTGSSMGVSGSLAKLTRPREELAADAIAARMHADRAALEQALLAATAAEFGTDAAAGAAAPQPAAVEAPPGAPFLGHVLFLVMVAVGAAIAALLRGGVHFHVSPGAAYEGLFGTGGAMFAALGLGGLLVGFGTRMSGGCTSGHGLSGCARLVPASLVATAAFLGAAIATSFLLVGWQR